MQELGDKGQGQLCKRAGVGRVPEPAGKAPGRACRVPGRACRAPGRVCRELASGGREPDACLRGTS